MFNETSYGLSDTTGCAALRDKCLQQWPDDDQGVKGPANQGLNKCLIDAGYWTPEGKTRCFESKVYDKPGATTYPLDVLTNPSNPDFVWQFPDLSSLNPKSLGIGLSAGVLIASAVVLFLLLRR